MTFREFELHRPRLSRQLADFASSDCTILDVMPQYGNGLRFRATLSLHGHVAEDMIAICVGPEHLLFNEADDGPGCCGTWWWEYDLP